jgi:hypothetical protein
VVQIVVRAATKLHPALQRALSVPDPVSISPCRVSNVQSPSVYDTSWCCLYRPTDLGAAAAPYVAPVGSYRLPTPYV